MDQDQSGKVRLSKLMSEKGICSRREADELIAKGLVYVNGIKIDQLGTKVDPKGWYRDWETVFPVTIFWFIGFN